MDEILEGAKFGKLEDINIRTENYLYFSCFSFNSVRKEIELAFQDEVQRCEYHNTLES